MKSKLKFIQVKEELGHLRVETVGGPGQDGSIGRPWSLLLLQMNPFYTYV